MIEQNNNYLVITGDEESPDRYHVEIDLVPDADGDVEVFCEKGQTGEAQYHYFPVEELKAFLKQALEKLP